MLKVAKKYILSFPAEKEEDLLDLLKEDWNFEVFDKKGESIHKTETKIQEIDYSISSIGFGISFLSQFAKKPSFIDALNNPRIMVRNSELIKLEKENQTEFIIKRTIELEKELGVWQKQIKENEEKIKDLEKFKNLSFVPSRTDYSYSAVLITDKKTKQSLGDFCLRAGIFLKEISQNQFKTTYEAIYLKEKVCDFLKYLAEIKSEVIDYPYSQIPEQEVQTANRKIKEAEDKINILKKEAFKLGDSLKELKVYYDFLCLKKRQLEMQKRTLEKHFLNYIVFWAEEEEKKTFQQRAIAISNEIRVIETVPEKDERPPVFLKNDKLAGPFQAVTDIYGLPSEKEIDPTPYLAVFFIVYFGICITDAAYGLIMAIATLIPLILFKKKFGNSKLLKLLFLGGISTFVIGILFGSYFGVSSEQIGLPFLAKFKIIDPMKDTVVFMGLTFLLGFIQICFSQVVRIIKGVKVKSSDDIAGGAIWLSFYLLSAFYILTIIFISGFKTLGLAGLIISGIGLMIVESKGQKIFLKPLVGLIKILQGLINTMSDILSYSRLMALGLGTAVIALIVNQIAFLFGEMIPYVGWLVAGLILIGGHLFNLGINALGGFIHSARLQFVEFFPKFLEGGGRRLQPIAKELKYIQFEK